MFDFIKLAWDKIANCYRAFQFVSKSFSEEEKKEYSGKITTIVVTSLISDNINEISDDEKLQIVHALGFTQELDNEGQIVVYTDIYDKEDKVE
jgi:hypothetical protein